MRRRPWVLATWTWLFLAWSLLPILVAVRIAFSAEAIASYASGFSLQWFDQALGAPRIQGAFLRSLTLAVTATIVAVLVGTLGAIGIARRRSRTSRAVGGLALLALGTPQLVLATALFLMIANLARVVGFGFPAQLLGHIGLTIPFVMIIVTARMLTLPRDYEEAAMDLGATATRSVTRVLLPLLRPSLVAASTVAFVLSYDNLVVSDQLCYRADCETIPMLIYNGKTGAVDPSPTVYAVMTTSLAVTMAVSLVALWVWSRLSTRRDGPGRGALGA